MKGRKPKLPGEAVGNRTKKKTPPIPPGTPECPDSLEGEERAEWYRLCGELQTAGRLSLCDRGHLHGACIQFARMEQAKEILRSEGITYQANGLTKVHPLVRVEKDACALYLRFLSEMGLTQVSRMRVGTTEVKPEDAYESFLKISDAG